MSRMFSLIGHSSFLILLLFSSVYSHSDHHQHIKDIIYKNIPFLAKSTTDNIGSSTTENPDINPTESSKLQQGTAFENFKEKLGWSLGALVSVPIVSIILFCCFCYCLCKCCAAICSDDEKGVIVVQNQNNPASGPPIIVQNAPLHQMQPMPQYHPYPGPQYQPPSGSQYHPQPLYQQPQYSPTGQCDNPSYYHPTAPPPYDTKAY